MSRPSPALRPVDTGKVSTRFILYLVSRGVTAIFAELTFIFQGSERLFVRSLDAGAMGRRPGFLVRETVRDPSDVELADVMKHKFRFLLVNAAMAFSNGLKIIRFERWCCGGPNGNQNMKYDLSEGASAYYTESQYCESIEGKKDRPAMVLRRIRLYT